ncbi:MAG: HAMP domain-containing histidine kinase, partial [Acetatifactor sp.]|nr:HAMP domain-containing histidine kinase [Acetatifactor sp.]
MRLFTKIFLLGMLVFGLAFSASGYFLLHYSLESSLARETDFALKQYQYDKFTVQSAMLTTTAITVSVNYDNEPEPDSLPVFTVRQSFPEGTYQLGDYPAGDLFSALASELSVPAAFFAEDRSLLYSNIQGMDASFLDGLTENAHIWQFCSSGKGGSILVGSMLRLENISSAQDGTVSDDTPAVGQFLYFVTQWDISKTLLQQETLRQYFLRCYLIGMAAGMALLILLSAFLTGPLNKMSKAARRMAEGNYGDRLSLRGRDEIGELAGSFNRMADAVEEKIDELAKAARAKEDFVANFAHELKTPLTSIIGYADTIYQKELSREETRRASWHIWNEGMRLEALSLKLMDMIVLGRQDFLLTELPGDELLQDLKEGLQPLFQERQVDFQLQAEHTYVLADYDLLKTLLINLTDNSLKAGATRIELQGQIKKEKKYLISVRDNGCGMEPEELSRITEAFYMVDKARSRKQHGAGLGLALADKIAVIHGDRLHFESNKGEGTVVSFSLSIPEQLLMTDGG